MNKSSLYKIINSRAFYCIYFTLLLQSVSLSQSVGVIEYERHFGSGKLYSIDIPTSFAEVEEETADLSFVYNSSNCWWVNCLCNS